MSSTLVTQIDLVTKLSLFARKQREGVKSSGSVTGLKFESRTRSQIY